MDTPLHVIFSFVFVKKGLIQLQIAMAIASGPLQAPLLILTVSFFFPLFFSFLTFYILRGGKIIFFLILYNTPYTHIYIYLHIIVRCEACMTLIYVI